MSRQPAGHRQPRPPTALLVVPLHTAASLKSGFARSREEAGPSARVATTNPDPADQGKKVNTGSGGPRSLISAINWDVNPPIIRVVVRPPPGARPTPKQVAECKRADQTNANASASSWWVERSTRWSVGPEDGPRIRSPNTARVPAAGADLPPSPVFWLLSHPEPEPKPLLQRTPLPSSPARSAAAPGRARPGLGSRR